MLGYFIRRLLATIPTIGMVAFFVFLLLYLTPGDPAAVIAGDIATSQDIERIRENLGLDQPFLPRFLTWASAVLRGDLGISIFTNLPVTQLIGQRVGPTLSLALCTLIVAVMVAVPMGVLAAWKAGKSIDRLVMLFSVAGFSIPVFVLAYVLIYLFAIQLDWLPVQGYTPLSEGSRAGWRTSRSAGRRARIPVSRTRRPRTALRGGRCSCPPSMPPGRPWARPPSPPR